VFKVDLAGFLRLFVDREIDDPGKGKTGFRSVRPRLGTDGRYGRGLRPLRTTWVWPPRERTRHRRRFRPSCCGFASGPFGANVLGQRGPAASMPAFRTSPAYQLGFGASFTVIGQLLRGPLSAVFLAPRRYSPLPGRPSFFARTRSCDHRICGCRLLGGGGWRGFLCLHCSKQAGKDGKAPKPAKMVVTILHFESGSARSGLSEPYHQRRVFYKRSAPHS